MSGNDLIMRPKVDAATLRRSAQQMEREYSNSGIRAARTTAQFAQQALTHAYRLSARAGASAMQSAFTVGLQAVGATVMSMLRQIDDTVDRVEGRASRIGGDLVNRAESLGVDAGNLVALDLVAGQKGVSSGDVDRWLGMFSDALREDPAFAQAAEVAENSGLEAAFVQYLQQHGDREGLAALGISTQGMQNATMLAQQLGDVSSFGEIFRTYTGGDIADVRRWIENAARDNAVHDSTAALMEFRELRQAGQTTEGQAEIIAATRLADQQMDFQREGNLDEALEIRRAGQALQEQLNSMVGELIKYVGDIVKAFQTGGFAAGISATLDPLTDAIGKLATNIKQDVKEGMREALSDISILGRKLIQDDKSEAKAVGDVRQPGMHSNPLIREIPL